MFFWYARRLGRWAPVRSAEQPYKISAEQKRDLHPFTDQGLGYYLDQHDRSLTLDSLVKKFPPPKEDPVAPVVSVSEEKGVTVLDYIDGLEKEILKLKSERDAVIEYAKKLEHDLKEERMKT